MMTFKEFLAEESVPLLARMIASLLKKGEKVQAYVEIFNPGGEADTGLKQIVKAESRRMWVKTDTNETWFEFNDTEDEFFGDDDDRMKFKQEKGIWTLREKGGKPILM
jgi:hypothetical protein